MNYVFQVRHKGSTLGGAFLLTRKWVVTAHHCVKRIPDGEEFDLVCVESGVELRGIVEARDASRDLAVIEVVAGSTRGRTIPEFAPATGESRWESGYRPDRSMPYLQGTVQVPSAEFNCAGGGLITHGIQLLVENGDDAYNGYSGSSVVKHETDGISVVGVLVEQNLKRLDRKHATKNLWAAAIREFINAFGFVLERSFDKILETPTASTQSRKERDEAIGDEFEQAALDRAAVLRRAHGMTQFTDDPFVLAAIKEMRADVPKELVEWSTEP